MRLLLSVPHWSCRDRPASRIGACPLLRPTDGDCWRCRSRGEPLLNLPDGYYVVRQSSPTRWFSSVAHCSYYRRHVVLRRLDWGCRRHPLRRGTAPWPQCSFTGRWLGAARLCPLSTTPSAWVSSRAHEGTWRRPSRRRRWRRASGDVYSGHRNVQLHVVGQRQEVSHAD